MADDDATEIIPARKSGNGKTAMPSGRKPFGSFAACFLAIIIMGVITAGVLSWFNHHIHDRVQWIVEVLTLGKNKADERFKLRSKKDYSIELDGRSDSDEEKPLYE